MYGWLDGKEWMAECMDEWMRDGWVVGWREMGG